MARTVVASEREALGVNVVLAYSDGRWLARAALDGIRTSGRTRGACLSELLVLEKNRIGGEIFLVVEEDPPALVGVAEVAEILDWDRRKVAVYAGRGLLPPPVAELAGGRVWKRSDIEAFREHRKSSSERAQGRRPRLLSTKLRAGLKRRGTGVSKAK